MGNTDPKAPYIDPNGPMFWLPSDPEDLQALAGSRQPSYHRNQPPQPYLHQQQQHQAPPPLPPGSYVPNGRPIPLRQNAILPATGMSNLPQGYGSPLPTAGNRGPVGAQYPNQGGSVGLHGGAPRLGPPVQNPHGHSRAAQNSVCPHCGKNYSRPDYLTTHIAGTCAAPCVWSRFWHSVSWISRFFRFCILR